MTGPRVLLMHLSERTSAKGTSYLSGWLGKARVVGFRAKEPDKFGNEQWNVYVAEPEPKADPDQAAHQRLPERGQRTWDAARRVDRRQAQAAGEAILAQAGRSEDQGRWIDDTDAAAADLQGRGQ